MDLDLGFVKLPRRLMYERVFQNEGLWKVFTWGIMKAAYKKRWVPVKAGKGTTEVLLLPGQFIFGRYTSAKELKMRPETVRDRLRKLKEAGFFAIQTATLYSVITIVNWDAYQGNSKKHTSQDASHPPTNRHKQEGIESKEEKTPALFSLKGRYSDQDLIDRAFEVIASTRKAGKVADTVLLAQLQKWSRYPVEQVEAGIRIYLEKDYASEGKREDYLLGIIRNHRGGSPNKQTEPEPPYYRKLN